MLRHVLAATIAAAIVFVPVTADAGRHPPVEVQPDSGSDPHLAYDDVRVEVDAAAVFFLNLHASKPEAHIPVSDVHVSSIAKKVRLRRSKSGVERVRAIWKRHPQFRGTRLTATIRDGQLTRFRVRYRYHYSDGEVLRRRLNLGDVRLVERKD